MAEISRKRTLKEFFDGGSNQEDAAGAGGKQLKKPTKLGKHKKQEPLATISLNNVGQEDEQDKSVNKALMKAQKALKTEEDSKLVTLDHHMSTYDETLISLHSVALKAPQLLQLAMKELLNQTASHESAEQAQTLLRTCFLYFFELMGITEDDKQSLDILFAHLAAKSGNVGKSKELTKSQMDKIHSDVDKIVFMTKSKTNQVHIRQFKRFCKVLATNLVDVFPAKKQHLQLLLKEILNFSRCKMRLVRLNFTHIGLYLFNQILAEAGQLETLKTFFKNQASVDQKRIDSIDQATDFFLNQSAATLGKELLVARSSDAQTFIRKAVYEHIAQLGPTELKLACQLPNFKLVTQLFKGVKDEEACLAAMQAILKISQRIKTSTDKDQLKILEKAFSESQSVLMQLALPSPENVMRKTPTLAIPVLESMASFFPNALTEQSKKQIVSCLHSGDPQVRDEAAKFLLSVCSDFDDYNSLLEIQKPPKGAKDNQDGVQLEENQLTINFMSEPNKSKKQLQKLISAVKKFILSREDFHMVIKQTVSNDSGAAIFMDESGQSSSYLTRMLGQSADHTKAIQEEKAKILAAVFGKKTSVVFDSKSICDLFQKEGQSEETKELLAHLLFIQLVLVTQNMQLPIQQRVVFQQYWELSRSTLTLSKLNEMIQGHRDNQNIVEPLLKAILVLANSGQGLESDSNESTGDILNLLTSTIASVVPSDPSKTNYLKVCLNVLNRVRNLAAEARPVTEKLLKDLFHTLQQLVSSKDDLTEIFGDRERLAIVSQTISKYNLFMGQLDISQLTFNGDQVVANNSQPSFLESSSKWSINFLAQHLSEAVLTRDDLSLADLKAFIQLPFSHLEHLIAHAHKQGQLEDVRVQIFAQSMSESLLDSLHGLYEALKQRKEHALCVFAFLAEVFVIIEDYIQPVVMSKVVLLVTQLIGEVSRPSFFSEEVSLEYFTILTNLLQRVPKLFASEAGTEYLAIFACSSGSGSVGNKTHFEKQVKKTLLSYKQRDIIDKFKRSVFYCLMLKTVLSLERLDDQKAYRLLSTTSVDVGNLDEVKDLAVDSGVEPAKLARLVLATRFIKVFQHSILLYVNSAGKNNSNQRSINKAQDECAYAKMIEDLTKQVLRSRQTVYLMKLLPQLIHTGFVSQKTKEAVLASFERMLNEHATRERDQNEPKPFLIDTSDNAAQANKDAQEQSAEHNKYLEADDRDFIQKYCIDAIRLKKQDRVTKAAKTVVMEDNEGQVGAIPDGLLDVSAENRDGSSRDADDEAVAGDDQMQEEECKVVGAAATSSDKVKTTNNSRPKKSNAELKSTIGKKKTKRQPSKDSGASDDDDDGHGEKPLVKKAPVSRRKRETKTKN